MANTARALMTPDEFLTWCLTQEEKWEFVDGVPVPKDLLDPVTGMTGTTRRHDRVTTNLIAETHGQLRGKPCRVASQDLAVRTRARSKVRRPDLLIECGDGATDMDGLEATSPFAVFEVLSPSTRQTDTLVKVAEYQGLPTLRHILVLETETMLVLHFRRAPEGGWTELVLKAPDAAINLPEIGVSVSLEEAYAGIPFADTPPAVSQGSAQTP